MVHSDSIGQHLRLYFIGFLWDGKNDSIILKFQNAKKYHKIFNM